MDFRILRMQKIFMVFLFSCCFVIPAYAEAGHCNFRLYSKATGHAVKACQTAENHKQCGKLLRRNYDRSRARAAGKKGRDIKFTEGDCSREALVGVCTLPHSKIYFYEGDTEELVEGCDRMKGHWKVKRL